MIPSRDISRLLEIMAALRAPEGGCPWDLEQDFASIAQYTIEEAYEVVDAITRNDLDDLGSAYSNLAEGLMIAGRTHEALEVALEGDALVPRRAARMSRAASFIRSALAGLPDATAVPTRGI